MNKLLLFNANLRIVRVLLLAILISIGFNSFAGGYQYESKHITFTDNGDYFTIKCLGAEYDGTNDELDRIVLHYLNPQTNSWVRFFEGYFPEDGSFTKVYKTDEVSNVSTSSEVNEKKHGLLDFTFQEGMFPGYVIFAAQVDWDWDNNDSYSAGNFDHTFYYSINGTDMRDWKNYFSYEYFEGCNSIEFDFLRAELYGEKKWTTNDADIIKRHELDDIKLQYYYNGQWNTILKGDCDNSDWDIVFDEHEWATTSEGTITTSDISDNTPSVDCYKTRVKWSDIPEKLLGKSINFRANYIWDITGIYGDDESKRDNYEFTVSLKEKKYAYNLNAVQNGTDIDLTWDFDGFAADASFVKYKIFRYDENNNSTDLGDITTENTKSFTDNSLYTTCVEYRYKIRTYSNCSYGNSTLSDFSNKVLLQRNDIPAATNITATQSGSNIVISWDFNPHADVSNGSTNYIVDRSVNGSNIWTELSIVEGISNTSFLDTDASACVEYIYRITVDCSCSSNDPITSSTTSNSINLPQSDFNAVFDGTGSSYFDGSKGYFNDYVKLEWEPNVDEAGNVATYEIYRKRRDNTVYEPRITIENSEARSFEDRTVDANVMYDYMLFATNNCDGGESDTVYASGFRSKTGIVTGKISYEGGNAVEGAKVYLDGSMQIERYCAQVTTGNIASTKTLEELTGTREKAYTFEYYTKLVNYGRHLNTPNFQAMHYQYNDYEVRFYDDAYGYGHPTTAEAILIKYIDLNDFGLKKGDWFHAAHVLEFDDANSVTLTVFINGDTAYSASATYNSIEHFYTDNIYLRASGQYDEFKIFSYARTQEEIKNSYRSYASGDEPGLITYLSFDENEPNVVFDMAHKGLNYYKNNFVGNDFTRPTTVPHDTALSLSGITDKYGKYRISSIPYLGNGSIYTVTPQFKIRTAGQSTEHEFDPQSIDLFIGDNSPVHNQVNFTDISSFTVSGYVYYYGGDYPVEDATILVDGKVAIGHDNKPIKTGDEGDYSVTVPIGYHYISVEKHGHVFMTDSSHFPYEKDDKGLPLLHEFDRDLSGINFVDSTLVKLAGKVVGGKIEQEKPLGLNQTNNNIGMAEIHLQILDNTSYNFDISLLNPSGSNTTSTEARLIENDGSRTIKIRTNLESGEYSVMLYPEQWEVTNFTILSNNTIDHEVVYKTDINLSNVFKEQKDSLLNDETEEYDYYSYNKKHDFIYSAPQSLEVTNLDETPFRGEDSIAVGTEYLTLWDSVNQSSNLGYPLFEMMKRYYARISVQEEYVNKDVTPNKVDLIPVPKENIIISNAFEMPTEEGVTVLATTDDNGEALYSFSCGAPEVDGGSILQSLRFKTETAEWPASGNYLAYVTGGKPIAGADFYSAGPEVDIILRDPPGSNSYAYIEKNSTFTTSEKWTNTSNKDNNLGGKMFYGAKFTTGIGVALRTNTINNSEYNITYTTNTNDEGERVKTLTFNERFSTSDSPLDEGDMADVFIGHAKNALISKTKNLEILEKQFCIDNGLTIVESFTIDSKDYSFAKRDGLVANDPDENTFFAFSQRYVIETEIPKIMDLKLALLADTTSDYKSNITINNRFYGYSNSDIYYLYDTPGKLNQTDRNFLDSIYSVVGDSLKLSYLFDGEEHEDKIKQYNNSIKGWYSALLRNETEKAIALNHTEMNISFDGSTGPRTSELTETLAYTEQSEIVKKYNFSTEQHQGAIFGGIGLDLSVSSKSGMGMSHSTGEGQEQSITFGFVLDDGDQGDAYSVNVNKINSQSILINGNQLEKINAPERYQDVASGIAGDIKLGVGQMAARGLNIKDHGPTAAKWLKKKVTKKVATESKKAASKNIPFGFIIGAAEYAAGAVFQVLDFVNIYEKATNISSSQDLSEWNLSGFSVSSPIFEVIGGRSQCPYTPEYESSLYVNEDGKTVVLSGGTWQRDLPGIMVDSLPSSVKTGVPADNKAYFELQLLNASVTESDQYYTLTIDDSTTNGAILSIDGYDPNRSFYVPYGQPLVKTLAVEMGKEDVFEYDSIRLILHSQCQYNPHLSNQDIYDEAYISVKFKPVCSDIEFNNLQDNWLISNRFDELNLEIKNYDLQNSELASVALQYKKPANQSFKNAYTWFVNNDAYYAEAMAGVDSLKTGLINNRSSLFYDFSAEELDLDNQQYLVRLQTTCYDKEGKVYTLEKPHLSGIVDRNQPQVFGIPAPQDGVLSPADEISIQFNEPIESGLVISKNITVTGVLNNTIATNNTSVYFDGETLFTKIKHGVNLSNKSFTIMFNAKRSAPESTEVFYSHGNSFEMGMIGADTLYWKIGSETLKKSIRDDGYAPNKWNTYAFGYNNNDSTCFMTRVNHWPAENMVCSQAMVAAINNIVNEDIMLGKGVKAMFSGAMSNLSIWNKYLNNDDLMEYKQLEFVGNELGLKGYWPMNEGAGNVSADKAGHRHMELNNNWTVENENYSLACDSSALAIPFSHVNITDESDMTMEFWFKAPTPDTTRYIFSRGVGNFSENHAKMDTNKCMSISVDESGIISLTSNGSTNQLVNANYFDNAWHHFAMVVDRKSNIKSYIDGELQKTIDNTNFSALAGDKVWLGAKGVVGDPRDVFTDWFNGNIDEFRIWSLARNKEQILMDYNSRLKGTEKGLMVYLPFEEYNDTYKEFQKSLYEVKYNIETKWRTKDKDTVIFATADEICTNDVPIVKLSRPVTELSSVDGQDYSYVVGEDKIIIELNSSTAKKRALTEHSTLSITVDGIMDKNGNELDPKKSWVAFVNQNPVNWVETATNIEINSGDSYEFTQIIKNTGGMAKEFEVINLPVWMSAKPANGVIEPNSELSITFTLNEALNAGIYDEVIYLKTDFGYNERIDISIKVKAPTPEWEVNTDAFAGNMTIIGQLKIDKNISTDEDDMVSVFINNECRGVSNVTYFSDYDLYLVFIEVYGNSDDDSAKLDFRVYDASCGSTHTNINCVANVYTGDAVFGLASNPVVIETTNEIAKYIPSVDGWSWISFNLETTNLKNLNKILSTVICDTASEIRGQNSTAEYLSTNNWSGNLDSLEIGKMYMLKSASNQQGIYSGLPVNPDSIAIKINKNWNWLGYTPEAKLPVNDALAYLEATQGDLIKSKKNFAIYDNVFGWIGSLNYLEPGYGYMYKSLSDDTKTFTYPKHAIMKSAKSGKFNNADESAYSKYPYNMNMVLTVSGVDNLEGKILKLSSDKEETIIAKAVQFGNETLYFATIHGNTNAYNLDFNLYDTTTHKVLVAQNSVEYNANAIKGTINDPFVVQFSNSALGNNMNSSQSIIVHPNPFCNKTIVSGLSQGSNYAVIDMLGKTIKVWNNIESNQIEWNASDNNGVALQPGTFLLINTSDATAKPVKLIYIK